MNVFIDHIIQDLEGLFLFFKPRLFIEIDIYMYIIFIFSLLYLESTFERTYGMKNVLYKYSIIIFKVKITKSMYSFFYFQYSFCLLVCLHIFAEQSRRQKLLVRYFKGNQYCCSVCSFGNIVRKLLCWK